MKKTDGIWISNKSGIQIMSTSLVFKWSKVIWLPKGPVLEWHLNTYKRPVLFYLSRRSEIEICVDVIVIRLQDRRDAFSDQIFDDVDNRRNVVDKSDFRFDHAELGQVATATTHLGSTKKI